MAIKMSRILSEIHKKKNLDYGSYTKFLSLLNEYKTDFVEGIKMEDLVYITKNKDEIMEKMMMTTDNAKQKVKKIQLSLETKKSIAIMDDFV